MTPEIFLNAAVIKEGFVYVTVPKINSPNLSLFLTLTIKVAYIFRRKVYHPKKQKIFGGFGQNKDMNFL